MGDMNIGRQFEEDLSEDFGLSRVPGSGNKWYNRLDIKGFKFRWSLKATGKRSASIKSDDIEEAIVVCSEDGSTPLWAYRIDGVDLIMMLKDDFVSFSKGEHESPISVEPSKGSQERKARAKIPALFRDG